MGLEAGVARVLLDPPLGVPMMGYGLREGGARERGDPLYARALYARSDAGEALVLELDVCLIAPAQADAMREEIATRTGLAPACVLVGCIHTHSGPDTGIGAVLAGGDPPAHVPPLLAAAVEAAVQAHASAAPARLGVGRAEARIGRNRRVAEGPYDTDVGVVRIDRADGSPLAILYLHGCHPTVLGHDNRVYSADWPGVAGRVVEEAHPGCLALFALAAHADIDPRTRGVMDLALEGQSVGAGFDAVETLGREVGEAVARAAAAIETRADTTVAATSRRLRVPILCAADGEEARNAALARAKQAALAALDLPTDARVRTGELFRLTPERTEGLPAEERRERVATVRGYLRDRTALYFAGGLAPEVEVQVLRLGDAWLLGLPLEPTVAVGRDWRARIGSPHASVVGIANGWLRYLPHPSDFAAPHANRSYEVLMATLVPDAASRLLDLGEELARDLSQEAA